VEVALADEIKFPIWLLRDAVGLEKRFPSLEHAGAYIEWMNEERPEGAGHNWPNKGDWDWTGFLILDEEGRRVHLRVEESTVIEARLFNEGATLEDRDLLARAKREFREHEATRRLPLWKKIVRVLSKTVTR